MNKLNNTDNSVGSRKPNEILRIILHSDLSFEMSANGF